MPVSIYLRARFRRAFSVSIAFILLALASAVCPAASIRGVVTDATGAKVTGANVSLVSNGNVVASAVSTADGSFQILTGVEGRFFLVVSAKSFRQVATPDFYAGRLDSIERSVVLEPQWVRESIVVTATGTPTPQAQTSAATSVLGPLDLALRDDMVSALRLMPGTLAVQEGQRGAQTSLFVRGGNSDSNKILVDGVSAGDMGGQFDFGPLSTTAVESAEVYRGTNSNLYGADAGSGVVSLTTPRGTTSFPSVLFEGDAGNFNTSREQMEVAGAHNKLDYLGAFSWLQTGNSLPMDEYHVATTAANVGWQPNGTTQIRGTLHYGVDATGVPNAWDFYHVTDDATEKDQDLFLSASVDNQTLPALHNSFRYGLTRKREQYDQWAQRGSGFFDAYGDSLGDLVTITGANGYSVTGRAILDFGGPLYSDQLVNNRDQFNYQGDWRVTPHLAALAGFHAEQERGVQNEPSYFSFETTKRTNYDYLAAVHGDFKNRLFYTLGGSLEHYSLFGTQTSPRAGLVFYAVRPRKGVWNGTRVLFNYGDGVREPKLTDEFGSLYAFLAKQPSLATVAQQLHIGPLAAPTTRSYEGGVEQALFGDHMTFRASYFHNQFGKEIESVSSQLLTSLVPGLTLTELGAYNSYYFNTEAFRAQGVETTVEGGIGRSIFLRGGYTYLDAVVQRSFSSDNEALIGGYAPTYKGIPIGAYTPLKGARPFRRPPNTGFFSASYAEKKITGVFTGAFASRSDDSTYLLDANYGSTLLLPNRNLNHGFAKLDLGGSYQLLPWLDVYAQAENLLSSQHIAPIGYPSLPMNFRTGLRIEWTKGSGR
jgi:iron complex outermembrane receptor protein/vitamin B12 transporter